MHAAIRQCAILAGGLGTRLGALTAATPKPVLPVGGRPFLAWLIRELSRFGIDEVLLLTGHLSARVREEVAGFGAHLPRPVAIAFSEEPEPAGTGGALRLAAPLLHDRFLLCNGDSLLAANLAPLLGAFMADPPEVQGRLLVRRLEDASRSGVIEAAGDRVTAFRERPLAPGPGLINAGIYALTRGIAEAAPARCSLERDVLPGLAARGALRATQADGFFIDIGVPEDFARAQDQLPRALRRRALFLDRDGVLNIDHGWVGHRDRFDWVPGAREAVRHATAAGWHVFVVTNQSGIARGLYTEDDFRALMAWVRAELLAAGGTLDDWRHCPFHPEAKLDAYRRASDWRKPAPGMLLDLIRAWQLDPAACIMVGDQETDIQAAAAAGMQGHRFQGGNLADFVAPLISA